MTAPTATPSLRASPPKFTTTQIPLKSQPATLLYDRGTVWVGGSRVLRVEDGRVIDRLRSSVTRGGIARAGDLLWATGGGDGAVPDGTVIAYDVDTGEILERHVFEDRSPYGIDAGGKGIFVALFQGDLLRITSHGISSIPLSYGLTQVLVAHGKVWVSSPQRGKVWRVVINGIDDTSSAATDLRGYPKRTCPQGLEASATAVWVADPCARKVWLLDPITGKVVDEIESLGRPIDIDIDSGRAWIVSFRDDLVTVVDLATLDVLAQAKAGEGATAIAVNGREAWVANHEDYSLTHFRLR